jgi:hypothetical protein
VVESLVIAVIAAHGIARKLTRALPGRIDPSANSVSVVIATAESSCAGDSRRLAERPLSQIGKVRPLFFL